MGVPRSPRFVSGSKRTKKKIILNKIRNWLETGNQVSPQIGLVVHHGAGNVTIDRIDELHAPVVELLSEGASRENSGQDD
jgi:hypothetical protein